MLIGSKLSHAESMLKHMCYEHNSVPEVSKQAQSEWRSLKAACAPSNSHKAHASFMYNVYRQMQYQDAKQLLPVVMDWQEYT